MQMLINTGLAGPNSIAVWLRHTQNMYSATIILTQYTLIEAEYDEGVLILFKSIDLQ